MCLIPEQTYFQSFGFTELKPKTESLHNVLKQMFTRYRDVDRGAAWDSHPVRATAVTHRGLNRIGSALLLPMPLTPWGFQSTKHNP